MVRRLELVNPVRIAAFNYYPNLTSPRTGRAQSAGQLRVQIYEPLNFLVIVNVYCAKVPPRLS